jgi:hypothetical protein
MKKLTFALFVALGATLLVSCGPKVDTPENLGKSLLEAISSQDKEAFAELFITKEEMTSLFDEASKTQKDESTKKQVEDYKSAMVGSFDDVVTKNMTTSYDRTIEKANKKGIKWDEVEFVRVESKEDNDLFKSVDCRVYFKTDNSTDLFLVFSAFQIGDEWKIVSSEGGIGGFK